MNTRRCTALTVLLLFGLAIPLAAQRGSQPRPSPRPSPSSQAPRPAPRPVAPAPRPAPRPVAPAPRPPQQSMPAPRPAPMPTPRVSAPRPTFPQPGNNARDNIARQPQAPTPRVVTPRTPQAPPTYTRPTPQPTAPTYPRPTTRSRYDSAPVAPTPTTRPTPTPRYPDRYEGGRYDGGSRPVGGTITRPTTRIGTDSPTRRVLPTTTTGSIRRGDDAGVTRRPNVTDERYAPARPDAVRRPVSTRPSTDGSIDRSRSSVRVTERAPSVAGDRASVRAGATSPTLRTRGSSAVVTTPSARLVPRSDAPRLGARRSGTSLVAGATGLARPSSYGYPYRSSHRSYSYCNSVLWSSWWDPWSRHGSHWNNCWSWSGGYGAFSWSASLWNPWIYYRTSWWDDCYSYSWYQSWSRPYCASSNYWWYPSTTYCPIYLQVPSSVVVVADPAPADAPAVDGGMAIGRAPAMPADVGARGLPADDLAAKYVELGRFYFSAGRFAEAADAFARARTYAPDDGALHFELADAAFANGDYHYAAFLIAEAVRLNPALATAEADKRDYYADAALFDTHMEALERYLASKPYDAQAHLVHGYNLRFSAQPEAAAKAFQRVLEITPENRAAQTFLAALEAAPVEPKIH